MLLETDELRQLDQVVSAGGVTQLVGGLGHVVPWLVAAQVDVAAAGSTHII